MSIAAECVVPESYRNHDWPRTFGVVPRVGDTIHSADDDSVEVVVVKISHAGVRTGPHEHMVGSILRIYCEALPTKAPQALLE